MRGPVTKLLRKLGCGFVLTDTWDDLFFGAYALDGVGIDQLQEGQWVEFELYDFEMGRATIARLHPGRSAGIDRCA